MARQVASLFGVLRLDDSDYKQKLSSATQQTNTLGQTLQNRGQQLQQFGGGMTAFFAPIGVAMGYAITQGHAFDRTFSNINSILQLGADDAADLRAELLRIGSNTVAGPQATAEAYYEIASGVADASTHMAILNAAISTSEAGQADLAATTSALISTMNAYGFTAEEAAHVSDVFTRTVGMGVLSMDELAAAFPQVTGLGAQFNVGIEELGAGMAYLTAQGYSASQSATFMKSMMTTLLAPTADLQTAITALGYESGAALLEAEGLTGAYTLLSQQNGGLDGLITNSEALQGALVLTNDSAGAFFTTYNEGISGATERAGLIQDETESWDTLRAQMDGLAIQLSTALMPTLNDLVTNYISPMVATVSDWMTKNPELASQIALVVGGLVIAGPIIGMVGTAMTIAGGAATALGVVVGLLASPFVALGLIIAGLVWAWNQPGGWLGTLQTAYTNASNLITQLNTIISLIPQVSFNGFGSAGIGAAPNLTPVAGGNVIGAAGRIDSSTVAGSGSFGGARADGGPVDAGREYLVGEEGPEMFVPRVSGTIIPNGQGGGGNTFQISATIYANTDEGGRAAARGLDDELTGLMRSKGIQGVQGV